MFSLNFYALILKTYEVLKKILNLFTKNIQVYALKSRLLHAA